MSGKKNEWMSLLTDYFIKENHINEDTKYSIYEINARDLITPRRLDLVAKWQYIDLRERNVKSDYAKLVYARHLEAFSDGTYTEPGSPEKNSLETYLKTFDDLIDDIKVNGFAAEKSLVPVGKDGVLLDGAHRVACCAYFDKKITVIEFPRLTRNFDYKFFESRGLSGEVLDTLASQYCELKSDVYLACIWPKAYDKLKLEAVDELMVPGSVVYKKELKLNYAGLRNLMLQIYSHHDWVGDYRNKFPGARVKADACFGGDGHMAVYAFRAGSLAEVLQLKQSIRDLFGVGNHSIHITDNQAETLQLAKLVFNKNSIHHLNHSSLDKYKSTHERMHILKNAVLGDGHNLDDYMIDASAVLSIYGIREGQDLDYLTTSTRRLSLAHPQIDDHDSQAKYYKKHKDDLIHNPTNHFVFGDMKFLALPILIEMKKRRGEKKDQEDIILIESLVKGTKFDIQAMSILVTKHGRRILRKGKSRIIWTLGAIGLKKPLKFVRSKVRR